MRVMRFLSLIILPLIMILAWGIGLLYGIEQLLHWAKHASTIDGRLAREALGLSLALAVFGGTWILISRWSLQRWPEYKSKVQQDATWLRLGCIIIACLTSVMLVVTLVIGQLDWPFVLLCLVLVVLQHGLRPLTRLVPKDRLTSNVI